MRPCAVVFAIFVNLVTLAAASSAPGPDRCAIRALRELAVESRALVPSPEQARRLEELRVALPTRARHREIMNILLELELKLLTPEEAAWVRDIRPSYRVTANRVNAEIRPGAATGKETEYQLNIFRPEYLASSALDEVFEFHERMHLIQVQRLRRLGFDWDDIKRILADEKVRYFSEMGVMLEESKLLQMIPPETRQEISNRIWSDRNLSYEDRRETAAIFEVKSKTARQHVREQHREGRYPSSRSQELTGTLEPLPLFAVGSLLVYGTPAGWYYARKECLSELGPCGEHPSTFFFTQICLKMPWVGTPLKALIEKRKVTCK